MLDPAPVTPWVRASLRELGRLDRALYDAVAGSDTPTLDAGLRRLSRSADHSALWLGVAALLALLGGARGRRAAVGGVVSIGVASAAVNLGFKPLARRARPLRGEEVPGARHVRMPRSTSFPSGHAASAFAFAEGVGAALPWPRPALLLAATTVAESRVHCGVHYPGDVVAGSLIGLVAGRFAATATDHAWLGRGVRAG
jgi:membrane-associated phospholipid phosphatase